jgi:hypothetical protein
MPIKVVEQWLVAIDPSFEVYLPTFRNNEVNGDVLIDITLDVLQFDLGIHSFSHRLIIMKAISKLKAEGCPSSFLTNHNRNVEDITSQSPPLSSSSPLFPSASSLSRSPTSLPPLPSVFHSHKPTRSRSPDAIRPTQSLIRPSASTYDTSLTMAELALGTENKTPHHITTTKTNLPFSKGFSSAFIGSVLPSHSERKGKKRKKVKNQSDLNEKSANEKSVTEKSVNEKSANEKSANEKSVTEKSVNEKNITNEKEFNSENVMKMKNNSHLNQSKNDVCCIYDSKEITEVKEVKEVKDMKDVKEMKEGNEKKEKKNLLNIRRRSVRRPLSLLTSSLPYDRTTITPSPSTLSLSVDERVSQSEDTFSKVSQNSLNLSLQSDSSESDTCLIQSTSSAVTLCHICNKEISLNALSSSFRIGANCVVCESCSSLRETEKGKEDKRKEGGDGDGERKVIVRFLMPDGEVKAIEVGEKENALQICFRIHHKFPNLLLRSFHLEFVNPKSKKQKWKVVANSDCVVSLLSKVCFCGVVWWEEEGVEKR